MPVVSILGEHILKVLADANETAKREKDRLLTDPSLKDWAEHVANLRVVRAKTYLAVATVLLTARALREPAVLDVRELKVKSGPKGYSAQAVGKSVATFVKTHGIDLRATSSQPINNQPFTAINRIERGQFAHGDWAILDDAIDYINGLTSAQAREALAYTFAAQRKPAAEAKKVTVSGGRGKFVAICHDLAIFVDAHIDGGRTGQALLSALLDVIVTSGEVQMGDVQDPDLGRPGDVHAVDDAGEPWLWGEVKQKPVTTGEVLSFVDKVHKKGGERVIYLALQNSSYPTHIDQSRTYLDAKRRGIELNVILSPAEAIRTLIANATGRFADVSERLLESMRGRLVESNGDPAVLVEFDRMASKHAVIDDA